MLIHNSQQIKAKRCQQVSFQKSSQHNTTKSDSIDSRQFNLSRNHFNHLLFKQQPLLSFLGSQAQPVEKVVDKAIKELSILDRNCYYNSKALQQSILELDKILGSKGCEVTDLDTKTEGEGVVARTEVDVIEGGNVQQRDLDTLNGLPKKTVESGLTLTNLQTNQKHRQELIRTLKTMKAATDYNPLKICFSNYDLTIHNIEVAGRLLDSYNSKSFNRLFDFCDSKDVFNTTVDKTNGLVKTSDASATENWEMSARYWVTDSCRNTAIMKKDLEHRKQISKTIHSLAKFYSNQQKAFDSIIANPEQYTPYLDNPDKDDSFFYEGDIDPMVGVGHIFLPDTFDEDPKWFNRRRLESVGLFLKTATDNIIAGLADKETGGYQNAYDVPQEVIDSIATTARYLEAIDYPYAPSAGNWEEMVLPGGLTWDTEAIKEGFKSLDKLLNDSKLGQNKQIQIIRKRLQKTRHADLINDHNRILNLIKAGEERVSKYSTQEAPGIRDLDSSLVFITHSPIDNKGAMDTIDRNMNILYKLEEALVRNNGMTRYAPFDFSHSNGQITHTSDSYLTLGYDIAVTPDGKISLEMGEYKDSFGAKDCSDPEVFAARAALAPNDDVTAQWFMISDMSTGYGVQLEKLLDIVEKVDNEGIVKSLLPKIKYAYKRETEFLNRGFARITSRCTKANGESCEAFKVPEAFMAVPTLDGDVEFLPGTNTSLTWAETSLYGASKQYQKNLETLERLGLLKQIMFTE